MKSRRLQSDKEQYGYSLDTVSSKVTYLESGCKGGKWDKLITEGKLLAIQSVVMTTNTELFKRTSFTIHLIS